MRYRFCLIVALALAMVQATEASQLTIVLRYDDYSNNSNMEIEKTLFETARSLAGGVLVGVIPPRKKNQLAAQKTATSLFGNLKKEKIDLLREYHSDGTVEIAVHGFAHRNNSANPNSPSEFAGLPPATQLSMLRQSREALEQITGLPINSFIPPYNTYDNDTLNALVTSGYKLLSAGASGKTLRNRTMKYLPGGPYPQKLKDTILLAYSKGHTDGLVVSTIHPYDILESGAEMAEFRHGSAQISIHKLIENLHEIQKLGDVRIASVRTLNEAGEDLSSERLLANLRLRESHVTLHHLLPEALNLYPVSGLYYSRSGADHLRMLQTISSVTMYAVLVFFMTFLTRIFLGFLADAGNVFALLVGATSIGRILAWIIKSTFNGFYMMSAVGLAGSIGVFIGMTLHLTRHRKLARHVKRHQTNTEHA